MLFAKSRANFIENAPNFIQTMFFFLKTNFPTQILLKNQFKLLKKHSLIKKGKSFVIKRVNFCSVRVFDH